MGGCECFVVSGCLWGLGGISWGGLIDVWRWGRRLRYLGRHGPASRLGKDGSLSA